MSPAFHGECGPAILPHEKPMPCWTVWWRRGSRSFVGSDRAQDERERQGSDGDQHEGPEDVNVRQERRLHLHLLPDRSRLEPTAPQSRDASSNAATSQKPELHGTVETTAHGKAEEIIHSLSARESLTISINVARGTHLSLPIPFL
jgi:hypothetical protein